jgi:DNA-binding phage protein
VEKVEHNSTLNQQGKEEQMDTIIIELLKQAIDESGMTMTAIAQKAGLTRETLYNRIAGKGEFTVSEVIGLTKALRLNKTERDYIFCLKS